MTQCEGIYDTGWFVGWSTGRFKEGQLGLCGRAVGVSAPVAETATVRLGAGENTSNFTRLGAAVFAIIRANDEQRFSGL